MSINLVNPETIQGKVDAAANFMAQIRLATMVVDKSKVLEAVEEAARHLSDALEQIENEE